QRRTARARDLAHGRQRRRRCALVLTASAAQEREERSECRDRPAPHSLPPGSCCPSATVVTQTPPVTIATRSGEPPIQILFAACACAPTCANVPSRFAIQAVWGVAAISVGIRS